jgi:hypothetical protein
MDSDARQEAASFDGVLQREDEGMEMDRFSHYTLQPWF